MSDDKTQQPSRGKSSALLMPNRYKDAQVAVKRDMPGTIVLVHGVNDVGVSFPHLDTGLCAGLNDRLNREDLFPNDFLMPNEGDQVAADPDAIYYRPLKNDKSRSPVLHFHWGYRATDKELGTELINDEVVDRHGNRLDKQKSKQGGMFVNATSNIPDMFHGNFNKGPLVLLANMAQDEVHNLQTAPPRRYMVLAAKRLAALVQQIRAIHPDETVTLIGHSQGCLISLTAQAFLHEKGQRPVDCLIMCHPPYGLHEALLEQNQVGWEQQTSAARIATLENLVKLITGQRHPLPDIKELHTEHPESMGRTGPAWSPSQGKRAGDDNHPLDLNHVFTERENRGKVYLYFCPHDRTVGLASVQGIGTLGVPDTLKGQKVMGNLGDGFFQRVWTWRQRQNGEKPVPVKVGLPPDRAYVVRKKGEPGYLAEGFGKKIVNAITLTAMDVDETRNINGEPLHPPFEPDLHYGEVKNSYDPANPEKQGKLRMDPIDAGDAVVKGGVEKVVINGVKVKESPEQARQRYQDDGKFDNSYHSSIVGNPEHHRWVTAMDVAIGQAQALDDPDWHQLLAAIADWRTSFESKAKSNLIKYDSLDDDVQKIVEATYTYYSTGKFPDALVPKDPPAPIVSATVAMRKQAEPSRQHQR